ncbi:FadR/GntR family transcriptional regulator [Parafrankia discariae]|uniref:FadR/GntR family transcriptional regulator n=1 Tax=Parafrankia discariae TaxID=365528 RepID=UPI000380A794|nr:FCD domain-containing protein [Parafrankia discariae]
MTPDVTPNVTPGVAPVGDARAAQVPRAARRRPRASEIVAESIRVQVARGELRPGDRFPTEDELIEIFGVARTTLREALRLLEAEGLVTVLRGRHGGPRVTSPTVDHISRVFALLLQLEGVTMSDIREARELVEPTLAHTLARTRTQQVLTELRAAVEAAAAAADTDDGPAFLDAATTLHATIAEHGGNRSLGIFAQLLHEVAVRCHEVSARVATATDRGRAVHSHRRFYQLVEAGDAAGAREHWRSRMTRTSAAGSPTGDAEDREDRGDEPDEPVDVFARPAGLPGPALLTGRGGRAGAVHPR